MHLLLLIYRYLSPRTKQPDARGIRPIDFNELRAVNPMDFFAKNADSAALARESV